MLILVVLLFSGPPMRSMRTFSTAPSVNFTVALVFPFLVLMKLLLSSWSGFKLLPAMTPKMLTDSKFSGGCMLLVGTALCS